MFIRLFSIIALAALTGTLRLSPASAQTSATAMLSRSELSAPNTGTLQHPELLDLKSERAAFRLSLLGTLIPVALGTAILATNDGGDYSDSNGSLEGFLIYAGLYVGPSLGYFYAGKSGRGLASFGLRNGIAMVSLVGAIAICPPMDYCDDGQVTAASAIIIAGGVGVLGSVIYDLANVRRTVRERNEQELASRVAVTPTYSRADGPGVRVSLAVQ